MINALRQTFENHHLQGFIIPRADEHQGEYIPECADRLRFMTNFTGSAGMAVVLEEKAAVFSDGRYVLQLEREVNHAHFDRARTEQNGFVAWVMENAKEGASIGYDPFLHTKPQIEAWQKAFSKKNIHLVPTKENLVDSIWENRPAFPNAPVVHHPLQYAGLSFQEKLSAVQAELEKNKRDALIICSTDAICWLFNIRGADIAHIPVCLTYAIVYKNEKPVLFLGENRLTPELQAHFADNVIIKNYEDFIPFLTETKGLKIVTDPQTTPLKVIQTLESYNFLRFEHDPILLMKAVKNETERKGMESAHFRDGIYMAQFLHFIDTCVKKGEPLDELIAENKLLSLRKQDPLLKDTSFNSISGFGPNGAVIHYRSSPETNLTFEKDNLYLIDSGGQYLDGTTDITRTIAIGNPSAEHKRAFTLVLKGHIALARARFPHGTNGGQLDVLARQYLWQAGMNYAHGTGHGVGCYLSVHEGPQKIAPFMSSTPLLTSMIVSNEPGYYKPNDFGIRLENLVEVVDTSKEDEEVTMLGFKNLTLAPFDRRVIDKSLLNAEEIAYLNAYHQDVYTKLKDHVDNDVKSWLKSACASL